jgi:hypothetical protein
VLSVLTVLIGLVWFAFLGAILVGIYLLVRQFA